MSAVSGLVFKLVKVVAFDYISKCLIKHALIYFLSYFLHSSFKFGDAVVTLKGSVTLNSENSS